MTNLWWRIGTMSNSGGSPSPSVRAARHAELIRHRIARDSITQRWPHAIDQYVPLTHEVRPRLLRDPGDRQAYF